MIMADRIGQQLGNYQLIRLLGAGGFADVYLGEHVYLKTQAAIKVLHSYSSDDRMRENFHREAHLAASLRHPYIVPVLDFGVENGNPFLVMDYAPKGTLRQSYPKGSRLSIKSIVGYVMQIADALQYAHDEKIIHRDIKPENMLIGHDDDILLSDFGIALIIESTRSHTSHDFAGTLKYTAPEQIQGKPCLASDQYALGIVVYEWICGEPPFEGAELIYKHVCESPPSLRKKAPEVTSAVEEVVLTALAKDPKRRFRSVHDFALALEQAFHNIKSPLLTQPAETTATGELTQPMIEFASPSQKIQQKLYRGWREDGVVGNTRVTVNDKPLRPFSRFRFIPVEEQKIRFEWGYAGGGPGELAVSILADYFNERPLLEQVNPQMSQALKYYLDFKRDVVTWLPKSSWELLSEQIYDWLEIQMGVFSLELTKGIWVERTGNQDCHYIQEVFLGNTLVAALHIKNCQDLINLGVLVPEEEVGLQEPGLHFTRDWDPKKRYCLRI